MRCRFLSGASLASGAVCCASLAGVLLLSGCEKRTAATNPLPAAVAPAAESIAELPADYAKLSRVFAVLGERARNAIPNGDPALFLRDLDAVLEAERENGFAGGAGLLYLCDKTHYLPQGYAPDDLVHLESNPAYNVNRSNLYLRSEAERALRRMGEAARADGITLLVSSTYRSYDYQVTVYNRLVALDGQEQADRESARPGTSQHQLGTVVDFGSIDPSWEPAAACQWLLRHAVDYGWSLSFPDGYEDVTGYEYECWHFRYIGEEACRFQKTWFSDIQQFMLEFVDAWRQTE